MRVLKGFVFASLAAALVLAWWTPVRAWFFTPPRGPAFEFTLLSVGQGDCALLVSPDGREVSVLDTGPAPLGGRDSVCDVLLPCLRRLPGAPRVERVVLSHFDADHAGGIRQLLSRVSVGAVIGPYAEKTEKSERVFSVLGDVPYAALKTGDILAMGPGLEAETLSAGQEEPAPENDRSLVLLVRYGFFTALFTGDITARAERGLASRIPGNARCSVLKVAHHGSRHSTGEKLLSRVRPQLALISCGLNNRFKHPSPETLARLGRHGAVCLRTDWNGNIRVRTDGNVFEVFPARVVAGAQEGV